MIDDFRCAPGVLLNIKNQQSCNRIRQSNKHGFVSNSNVARL